MNGHWIKQRSCETSNTLKTAGITVRKLVEYRSASISHKCCCIAAHLVDNIAEYIHQRTWESPHWLAKHRSARIWKKKPHRSVWLGENSRSLHHSFWVLQPSNDWAKTEWLHQALTRGLRNRSIIPYWELGEDWNLENLHSINKVQELKAPGRTNTRQYQASEPQKHEHCRAIVQVSVVRRQRLLLNLL